METNQDKKTFIIKQSLSSSELIHPQFINVNNRAFTEDELVSCKCSWYEDKDDPSARMISIVSGKHIYQGTTRVKGNISKSMLVLQNKKTNKIQLIEMGECRLGGVFDRPSELSKPIREDVDNTYDEHKTKLLRAFGSKRSNRVSEICSKIRINNEMMNSQMSHMAADVNVDVKDLQLADSSVDTCLPVCHRDATSLAGVYPLSDLLSQDELDSLEDEAIVIISLMPLNFTHEESGLSQFFLDTLERLSDMISLEKVQILLYVEALLRFINLPLRRLRKKDVIQEISPFSNSIGKKIVENFTIISTDGRTRNMTMEDKIVVHLLVLLLHVCDYNCNIEDLFRYLPNFNFKKLGEIARALCLSTRDKITWFIKLPLPAPRLGFKKRTKNVL